MNIIGSGYTSKHQDTYMEGPFYQSTGFNPEKTHTSSQNVQNQNLFVWNQNQHEDGNHQESRRPISHRDFKIRDHSGRKLNRSSSRKDTLQRENQLAQTESKKFRIVPQSARPDHYQGNQYQTPQHASAKFQESSKKKLSKKHNGRFLAMVEQDQDQDGPTGYPKTLKEAMRMKEDIKNQPQYTELEKLQARKQQKMWQQLSNKETQEMAAMRAQQEGQPQQQQFIVKKRKTKDAKKKPDIPQSIFHSEEAYKRLLIKQYKDQKQTGGQPQKLAKLGVSQSLTDFLFKRNPQKTGNLLTLNGKPVSLKSQYKPGYSKTIYQQQMIDSYIPCLQGESTNYDKNAEPTNQLHVDMFQTAASSIGFHSKNERRSRSLYQPHTRYEATPKHSGEVPSMNLLGATESLSTLKAHIAYQTLNMMQQEQ